MSELNDPSDNLKARKTDERDLGQELPKVEIPTDLVKEIARIAASSSTPILAMAELLSEHSKEPYLPDLRIYANEMLDWRRERENEVFEES